jgi:hypothetical protein
MSLDDLLPHLRPYSRTLDTSPLHHLGRRYDATGAFLPEPGNTIVCHLLKGSASERAVVAARQSLMDLPEARENLAFTPVPSLHMTLFQGIIEYRRTVPFWPQDMPLDTPIKDMTAHYLRKLESFVAPGPFTMTVTDATPEGLTIDGATAADRACLKEWRDRLASAFGYRHPDHDSYRYHITFAYVLRRFSDEAILAWDEALPDIVARLRDEAPTLELAPPAYCSFEDMKHFEELRVLAPA